MKAFRFTLEAVETVRQRQEQQAMETYVHVLLVRQQALERVEAARERIRLNQQEMNRLLGGGCTASELAHAGVYERALEKQHTDLVVALSQEERRVQAALQAMLAARRRRKMVGNFRAKQLARHQRAEWREEQKQLDDLASRRGRSVLAWNPEEAAL